MSTETATTFKNARFWIWHNCDWIKITLQPHREISFSTYRPDSEGYHSTWKSYTHEGDRVLYTFSSASKDCDGRYEDGGCSECPIDQLTLLLSDHCPPTPNWRDLRSFFRDHSAEAMNY